MPKWNKKKKKITYYVSLMCYNGSFLKENVIYWSSLECLVYTEVWFKCFFDSEQMKSWFIKIHKNSKTATLRPLCPQQIGWNHIKPE